MKVLVHLSDKENRSYWLDFGTKTTKQDMADLLKEDPKYVIGLLFSYAALMKVPRVQILDPDKRKFEIEADYTVS